MTLGLGQRQGVVFHRTISVDEDYMFKIVDEVENKTGGRDHAAALCARAPQRHIRTSQVYYILHEGLIGVSGEHGLQEVTYADASRSGVPKTFENVTGGWLGITDKYWAAALVPDQTAPTARNVLGAQGARAASKDAFQADYLRGTARRAAPGSAQGIEAHLFAGAKQVDTDRGLRERARHPAASTC